MLQLEKIKLFFLHQEINTLINNGEILGILGQSGSGKTSLLKAIKGFFPKEKGLVLLDGEIIAENTDYRLGFVHQQATIFEHWSIEKNIIFGDYYVRKNTKEACLKKMERICEAFGLTSVLKKDVNNLSVGEKQRLSIARCLMLEPKAILMDEPSSALDPENIKKLRNIILKLKELGVIFIISSHDMSFMETLCDKIIFLSEGNVLFNGMAENFWNHQNKKIQEFTKANKI